jgi:hypothetical protein
MPYKSINKTNNRTYKSLNEIIIKENHAEIILYKSKTEQIEIARALISLDKVNLVKNYKWHLRKQGYVRTTTNGKGLLLHKLITNTNEDILIDHKFGNKLDNRDEMLRIADKQKNAMNSKLPDNSSSGVKGVSYDKRRNKWRAYVKIDQKQIFLGYFEDINDAINIRKESEVKYFKEFQKIN